MSERIGDMEALSFVTDKTRKLIKYCTYAIGYSMICSKVLGDNF